MEAIDEARNQVVAAAYAWADARAAAINSTVPDAWKILANAEASLAAAVRQLRTT